MSSKNIVDTEVWQFTKENYREGAPPFIKNSNSITLFSQYGGEVISGEITTPEGIMVISENDYIIKDATGRFYLKEVRNA